MNYENRLVAFIDILGFSKLIGRSEQEPGLVPWIFQILNAIKSNEGIKEQFGKDLDVQMEFTAFSDCFVLSTRVPEDPVNTGLYQIALICTMLLKSGLFARGAVVEGQLFHKNNIVLGPALLSAYDKEQNEAKYPRIIISDELVEKYNIEIQVPELDKFINQWSSNLIRSDNDNKFYLDTLYSIPFSLKNADEKAHIEAIKIEVLKQIELNNNKPNVLGKYIWFKNFVNSIIEEQPHLEVEKIE